MLFQKDILEKNTCVHVVMQSNSFNKTQIFAPSNSNIHHDCYLPKQYSTIYSNYVENTAGFPLGSGAMLFQGGVDAFS